MIFKKIALGLLSLCLLGTSLPSEAGNIKKAVGGVILYQSGKAAVKHIAKNPNIKNSVQNGVKNLTKKQADKLAKKTEKEKLAKGPLVNGELKTGRYEDIVNSRLPAKSKAEQLQAHHIPSKAVLKRNGIDPKDGASVEMKAARHEKTRTFGGNNTEILKSESPRNALARDVKDFKKIYKHDPKQYEKAKNSAKKIINYNKKNFPNIYKKDSS